MISKLKMKIVLALVVSMVLVIPASAMAASAILDVSVSVYAATANDINTDYFIGGYDVAGTTTYAWANNNLQVIDNTTGAATHNWGTPTDGYSGYNSFVTADGSGGAYVGFTVSGNTDDRIYHVDSAGAWSQVATMAGNYDAEIFGGNLYVSGLNSTDWSDPNSVWLLDTSGSNAHDLLVEMSGSSAGLSFDNSGNLYYASYDNLLYSWSASDIAGAIGGTNLTYADGTKLADIELGANDVAVDDAGNIIFNGNGGYSYIAMWNGTEGDGYNYDYIGIGSGEYGNWLSALDAEGDVTADGSIYQADYYAYGLAEVNAVPVPAAAWLLGSGLLGLIGIRRRRA